MKRIVVLFFVCCLVSCSSNDDDSQEEIFDASLVGVWTLTDISCFCAFPDPSEFNQTQISFNFFSNALEVVNNGDQVFFRENGTYPFTSNANENTFTLEDGSSFIYEIVDDFDLFERRLQLRFVDDPILSDDEVTYFFVTELIAEE